MNGKAPLDIGPYDQSLKKLTDATMAIVSISTSLLSACKLLSEQYTEMYQRLKEAGIDWDLDEKNSLSEGNINRRKVQAAAAEMKAKRGKSHA